MKRIIAATLLAACSAADTETIEPPEATPVQVTNPSELKGDWCGGGTCLEVRSSVFGAEVMVYDLTQPGCWEGGFMGLGLSGQIELTALFRDTGCLSHRSPSHTYSATFVLTGEHLTVQASVPHEPIVLTAE